MLQINGDNNMWGSTYTRDEGSQSVLWISNAYIYMAYRDDHTSVWYYHIEQTQYIEYIANTNNISHCTTK